MSKLEEKLNMFCPNCGKEMIKTGYRYKCSECNIKYNNLKNIWNIPKSITVDITDKQQNCIKIICKNLNINFPYIINKKVASKFIDKYLNKSKAIMEEQKREFDANDYIMWDYT